MPELGAATMTSPAGATTVVDRPQRGRAARDAELYALSPNANVMYPHAVVAALDDDRAARMPLVGVRGRGVARGGRRVLPEQAPELDPALVEQLEGFLAEKAAS